MHAVQDHTDLAKFAESSGTHAVVLQMEIELLHLECFLTQIAEFILIGCLI